MNTARHFRLLAVLAVLALAVAACASETADTTVAGDEDGAATTTTGGDDGDGDEEGDGDEAPSIEGATFNVGFIENISTDNWWAAQDTENSSYNQYLDSGKAQLFKISLPGFVLIPDAAATDTPVKSVKEGDVWVVEQPIRDDLYWSDGVQLTANDYVFYFDTVREFNLQTGHALVFPENVADVSAPDDFTVRVEFNTDPGLSLWNHGACYAVFVPSHFWAPYVDEAKAAVEAATSGITAEDATKALVDASIEDEDPENDLTAENVTQEMIDDHIASTGADEGLKVLYDVKGAKEPSVGPMLFDKWENGAFASTLANPGHRDRGNTNTFYADGAFGVAGEDGDEKIYGLAPGGGENVAQYAEGPFVSDILWVEHSTKDAAYEKLGAGEIDYVWDPTGLTTGLRNELSANPDLDFSVNESDGFRYMAFNMRRAPMSDLAFRQAVSTVVNKELVAETVLAGGVIPGYTIINPALLDFYNPDAVRYGWKDGEPMSEGDRFVEAVKILKDAGYTWESEPVIDPENRDPVTTAGTGLTMPNGEKVQQLELLAPGPGYDPFRATFAIWIEQWMSDLGIPVKTDSTDFNAIVAAVFQDKEADWDMYMLGWGGGDPSLPVSMTQFFAAESDATTGGSNTPGYNSPEFEEELVTFRACKETACAGESIKKMEAMIAEDAPYVVLFRTPIIEAFRKKVRFPVDVIMGGHNSQPDAWPSAVQLTSE